MLDILAQATAYRAPETQAQPAPAARPSFNEELSHARSEGLRFSVVHGQHAPAPSGGLERKTLIRALEWRG